jgi:hypothetical protein
MRRFKVAVADLNQLAGDGHLRIVKQRGVHKFQPPPALPLLVFSDGIFLRGGPLRTFDVPATRALVADGKGSLCKLRVCE